MVRSISRTGKRGRGRPRVNPTSIHLSLSPVQLEEVDNWIARQNDMPSRPEAIRRLLAMALGNTTETSASRGSKRMAAKASEMALSTLARLGDTSAAPDEQAKRKRRLLKGPSEFRKMRDDLPRPKR
jgi:hypothetical protein